MYKFNIEDISSDIEVIVFPRESKNYSEDFFVDGEVVLLNGSISRDGDDENYTTKLVLNSCEKFDLSKFAGGKPIYLKTNSNVSKENMTKINDIINANNGGSYVFIEIQEGPQKINVRFNKSTSLSVKDQLEQILKESQ